MPYFLSLLWILLTFLPAIASPLPSEVPPPRTRIGRTKGVGTRGCEVSPDFRIVAPDVLTTKVARDRPQFLIYASKIQKFRVTIVRPKVAQPLYDKWFSPTTPYTLIKTDSPFELNQTYRLTVVAPCSVDSSHLAQAFLLFQVKNPSIDLQEQLSQAQNVASQAKIYTDNGYFLEAISLIFTNNPERNAIDLINALVPDNYSPTNLD
jgi:hypothetical protein